MFVDIEASGCPNTCRHCSVEGRPPCGSLYSIEELSDVAKEWGSLIYLHEPTAHPEFPEIFAPDLVGDHYSSGWLPTCGFGIARHGNHTEILSRFRDLGFTDLSFTFHGLRDHHDWFTARRGSFDEAVMAARRSQAAGFRIHWQIFVDRRGLDDVEPFVRFARSETGKFPQIRVPWYEVNSRLWRYERLRPTLAQIRERGIDKLAEGARDDQDRPLNALAQAEELTWATWLSKWRQSDGSNEFTNPFEPDTWPPKPPFQWIAIQIRRNRSVYLDLKCAPSIRLGHLQEGRDELLRRLAHTQRPAFVDMTPEQVELSPDEEEELHPYGYSLRNKAIAIRSQKVRVDHRSR